MVGVEVVVEFGDNYKWRGMRGGPVPGSNET